MSEKSSVLDDDNDISDQSNERVCPLSRYDCRDVQFEESSLQEHYHSEKHQKSVVRCAQQLSENKNGNPLKPESDIPEEPSSLVQTYSKLSTIAKIVDTNSDELSRLEDVICSSNNENAILSEQLPEIQREISLEKAQLNAISTNQSILKQDIISLQQQVDNDNQIAAQPPDGTMIWKVTDVREKMCDAQSERQTSVYSPPFFTSISGYCVCVRLYLNGDGSARGTHISIFLVILRGPYDNLLQWPFSYRVSFCLYDQRTTMESNGTIQPKHIIESFKPDVKSISFEKPRSAMNIASGIPKFFSLDEFNQSTNKNLYIINDTMYIKAYIDFIGVSRSMLPFIFNINIALPVHIQHKLISDEIKRREEQNVT